MEQEIWKDITGFEGLYQLNSRGIIKSLAHGKERILKPDINIDGYLTVSLYKNNKSQRFRVHRLVAIHFIPNPNNYPNVLHKDDNPLNPNVDNLFWGTTKDNMNDKVKKGRQCKGEESHLHTLTEQQVLEIRAKYIPKIYSQRKLAKEYGVSQTTIKEIVKNKTWKHINKNEV